MKKIRHTRLLKKLGMLAIAIAPIVIIANGDGDSGASVVAHATAAQVRSLLAIDVSVKPKAIYTGPFYNRPTAMDVSFPKHIGFSFTFYEASWVDTNGMSIFRFYVKSSDPSIKTTKLLSFEVFGFKTKAVFDADSEIDALRVADITAPTKKSGAMVAYNTQPQTTDINKPVENGFTFTFVSATPVASDGTSDVTYRVTKEGVVGAKTRNLLFRGVTGFQTEAQANVVAANNAIDALRVADITAPTKKATVAFGETPEDDNFNPPSLAGYTFTFIGATSVSASGTSDATYIVTKTDVVGAKTRNLLFRGVTGFQTEAQANVVAANNAIDALRVADITAPTKKSGAMVAYNTQPQTTDINKPVESGFTFTFVSATPVASDGTSDVTYRVTKEGVVGAKTRNLLFRGVTGFQTEAQANVVAANNAIDALRVADITAPTKKSGAMVAYNTQPQTTDINKPVENGFTFTFVSATPVASDGTSDVTYRVTKEGVVGAKTRNLLFRGVTGFQTEAQANVVAANNAIDALRVADITAPTKKATVAFGETPEDDNFNPPSLAGYTFTFIGATSVSASGTSDATYIVTKTDVVGAKTRNLLFRGVTGFQTEAQANVVAANNAIDALRVADITAPTKKSGAMVAYNTQPQTTDINKPVESGFTFTFVSATPVASDGTSDVTYRVTKEGVVGAKTRNLLFRGVTGFQTEAQANVVAANNAIDALRVADITAPTKKSGAMVAYNTQPQTTDINKPVENGFTFTFVSATPVASDGTSDVTYRVTKEGVFGAKTRNLLFRGVTGFQTEAQANVVAANNAIDALRVADITAPTKKATVAFGETPEDDNFNPPSLAGYTFTFIGATSVSASGTSDATYIVTKTDVVGAKTRNLIFRGVTGFQTEAQANVVAANNAIDALRVADITAPTKKSGAMVAYNTQPQTTDINKPVENGFTFTFVSATPVASDGTSDVTYRVTKEGVVGAKTRNLLFRGVTGFQTEAQANVVAANNAIDALRVADITAPTKKSGAMVAYNTQPQTTDINKPVENGFTFTFVSATPVASDGTSDVTYRVTKEGVVGAKTRNLLFRGVTGFQTEAQANVVAANNAIDALRVADITAPTKKSGAMVAYNTQPQTTDINKPVENGFTFTFVSATPVASDGTSDVTYRVTKEGVVGAKTRNLLFRGVTGFQTEAEAIDALVISLSISNLDTSPKKAPSRPLVEIGASPVAEDFTLPIKSGVEFQFIKATAVSVVGESVATFKASSSVSGSSATKDLDFTISGFGSQILLEANKFKDFKSTDNDKSDAAVLDASDEDVQGTFKAITGYSAPNLVEGVTIKSISVKNAINDSRQVVFTIRLGFGETKVEKDVTVTFAVSPSQQTKDTALTTTQIVGIGIGSALGLGMLGYLIYYLIKRRR